MRIMRRSFKSIICISGGWTDGSSSCGVNVCLPNSSIIQILWENLKLKYIWKSKQPKLYLIQTFIWNLFLKSFSYLGSSRHQNCWVFLPLYLHAPFKLYPGSLASFWAFWDFSVWMANMAERDSIWLGEKVVFYKFF